MKSGDRRAADLGDGEALTVAAVARRLGVAPATLRTWDRRYGLGPSEHSSGEHRRYSSGDITRLTLMRKLVIAGVSPAEAAQRALAYDTSSSPDAISETLAREFEIKSDLVESIMRAARAYDRSFVEDVILHGIQFALNASNNPVSRNRLHLSLQCAYFHRQSWRHCSSATIGAAFFDEGR